MPYGKSTLKAVLLLTSAFSAHRVLTPPTPPPKPEFVSKYHGGGNKLNWVARWYPTIGQIAIWSSTLCEVVVIILHHNPSVPFADPLLAALTFGSPSTASELNTSTFFIIGWIMAMLGGTLRLLCYHQLGQQFTFQLAIVDSHKLITTGLYAVVRHPSYTAWMLFISGLVMMQFSPGSWIVQCDLLRTVWGSAVLAIWIAFNMYISVMIPQRMRLEDAALKKQFGDQWVQWSKATPYKLVPGLY
ncbi:hypothetical protein BC628DRAFT_1410110 [Trametes gibbosa]|nr:hypothetical protein BC628DRAFT_1410110 [Trametes gibbosa]